MASRAENWDVQRLVKVFSYLMEISSFCYKKTGSPWVDKTNQKDISDAVNNEPLLTAFTLSDCRQRDRAQVVWLLTDPKQIVINGLSAIIKF